MFSPATRARRAEGAPLHSSQWGPRGHQADPRVLTLCAGWALRAVAQAEQGCWRDLASPGPGGWEPSPRLGLLGTFLPWAGAEATLGSWDKFQEPLSLRFLLCQPVTGASRAKVRVVTQMVSGPRGGCTRGPSAGASGPWPGNVWGVCTCTRGEPVVCEPSRVPATGHQSPHPWPRARVRAAGGLPQSPPSSQGPGLLLPYPSAQHRTWPADGLSTPGVRL